ncbi:MAG TPA: substrate-binding domain-containing protein [Chthoniobacterales bacterium]|jgi:quinoprotein dehydrogenase-associated probable ABC transporter substrate-binding protein|nr:substrate-binding domain-containing protein [Chthoniobacterales bacterium]
MFSLCRSGVFLLFATATLGAPAFAQTAGIPLKPVLRVAADPNNLPFSDERGEGFENKIAELIARELDMNLEFTWRAQRRGFFRETLKENRADLVLGVPAHFDLALTTSPYYRSSYVFVYRKDRGLDLHSLDDPVLRKLKIGVQMIGNDGVNTPPAHALANRGIIDNVVGYTVYGNYTEKNPPARAVDAAAKGEIDVAIVWGPLGGYFAGKENVPLTVVPVSPAADRNLPFTFSIAMGVRKGDTDLRDRINKALAEKKAEIDAILIAYHVPRVPDPPTTELVNNK